MSEQLRIALIGQRSLPADYSGVEVYAEEVGARLAERGHQVTAFCSLDGRSGSFTHRGVKVEFVKATTGKHTRAVTQTFASTLRALRSDYDVVHYMAMGPTIASPLIRWGSSAAVVATVQGRDDQRAKWSKPAQLLMRSSLETMRRVPHRLLSVSQELYDDFLPHTGDRLRRIPNGIAESATPPDAGEIVRGLGAEPGNFILFAGRLVPEKRVHDLIAGFRRANVDHQLVIAGASSWTDDYVQMLRAAAEGDDRILFVGHRSPLEVNALNRTAALFALVSELEGLPIALLEAASRATPLLVSDLPCNVEVVGESDDGAGIVGVGAVEQITTEIERILASPDAEAAAKRRSERVLEEFGWDRVVDQIEAAYLEAIAERAA